MSGLASAILALLLVFPELDLTDATNFCSALVESQGYPCQEYEVTTEDGYILSVHRIPHSSRGDDPHRRRPPVFLQHGVLQGGDSWVLLPQENSLAFFLAERGFDVWIGSFRGTHWSKKHTRLSATTKAYWNWTWDEHAAYDLPAMLQLAHGATGSKLHYVGHSQGTLVMLASLSQSTGMQQLVQSAVLLSPIAYLRGMTSILSRLAAAFFFDEIYDAIGQGEFALDSGLGASVIKQICLLDARCGDLLFLVTGRNCCFNTSLTSYYRQFEPQGSSTKNLVHLAQMVRTGLFSKFDYGSTEANAKAYSIVLPPQYEPWKIPTGFPIMLAYGGNDALSTPAAVRLLAAQLSACKLQFLYIPFYAHVDFVLGTRAKTDIFEPVADFLRRIED